MNHNGNGRHIPILGSNGAPTKLNLSVQYSPGPLAHPVVLPPINAEGGFLAPAFGGATRMETAASRLLAGAMTPELLERLRVDASYRRMAVEAAVLTAWDLIGAAASFAPPAEDAEQSTGEPDTDEPDNKSGIVLPD